jgi:predicted nuclease of restriction endonuclease-like (RecB) superfamily
VYLQLGWSQYKIIIRLDSQDKRDFYIAETIMNNWTVRQLERQIHSSLWERLLMSNDKDSVLAVARNEKQLSDAKDHQRPYVLGVFRITPRGILL